MVQFKELSGSHYHIHKTNDQFELELINKLISDGYKSGYINMTAHDLFNSKAVGICINTKEKSISLTNVTCMACYCSKTNYAPITSEVFLLYYDQFIKDIDFKLYSQVFYFYTVFKKIFVK